MLVYSQTFCTVEIVITLQERKTEATNQAL